MIISASKLVLAMSHIYKCYEIKITPRIEFSYKKFPKIPVALFWLFNYREFSNLAVHWLSVTSLFNFSSSHNMDSRMETQLIHWHPQATDLQTVLNPIIILEPNNEFLGPQL